MEHQANSHTTQSASNPSVPKDAFHSFPKATPFFLPPSFPHTQLFPKKKEMDGVFKIAINC